MLTIFATAKPFRGHDGIIQRNAVASWTRLRPQPESVLRKANVQEQPGRLRIVATLDEAAAEARVHLASRK